MEALAINSNDQNDSPCEAKGSARHSEANNQALQTRSADQKKLERLAWLLDDAIPLPGGYRVGLDGVVGLIPGVGDAAGLVASSYILLQATRMDIPGVVIARMVGNVVLEMIVGVVPFVGDLFDFIFKANRRNVALMHRSQRASTQRSATRRRSWVVLGGVILALLLVFAATLWVAFMLLAWIVSLF